MTNFQERNKKIALKILNGATLLQVAREYCLTPERIRQITFKVCLQIKVKNKIRDKLPENWFYLSNLRKYKNLFLNSLR